MFGPFSALSWAVSTAYPIFASYKAYDNYVTLATRSASTTVNFGGVAIPLGTMLKRATTSETSIEEDTLNSRLLSVQMWMIYWIVNGFVQVVESVLLLRWLPLYSVARLGFSVWLVAPIVLNSARLSKKSLVTHSEIQSEWVTFSQQGCGLVYFQYIKPLMEGQLSFLYDLKPDELLGKASGYLAMPIFKLATMSSRGANEPTPESSGESGNYMQTFATLSSFSKSYFAGRGSDVKEVSTAAGSATQAEDLDEYDVVDAPSMNASVAGLKNRNVPEKAEGRRWFW